MRPSIPLVPPPAAFDPAERVNCGNCGADVAASETTVLRVKRVDDEGVAIDGTERARCALCAAPGEMRKRERA